MIYKIPIIILTKNETTNKIQLVLHDKPISLLYNKALKQNTGLLNLSHSITRHKQDIHKQKL